MIGCLYPGCEHEEQDSDREVAKQRMVRHMNQTHPDGQAAIACACTKGGDELLEEVESSQVRARFPNPEGKGRIDRTVTSRILACTRCEARYNRSDVTDEQIAYDYIVSAAYQGEEGALEDGIRMFSSQAGLEAVVSAEERAGKDTLTEADAPLEDALAGADDPQDVTREAPDA